MSFLSLFIAADSLHLGSAGEDVKRLQGILNQKLSPSPNISVDGLFGPATAAAVVVFQKANGLFPDSVVGPKTRKALGL